MHGQVADHPDQIGAAGRQRARGVQANGILLQSDANDRNIRVAVQNLGGQWSRVVHFPVVPGDEHDVRRVAGQLILPLDFRGQRANEFHIGQSAKDGLQTFTQEWMDAHKQDTSLLDFGPCAFSRHTSTIHLKSGHIQSFALIRQE